MALAFPSTHSIPLPLTNIFDQQSPFFITWRKSRNRPPGFQLHLAMLRAPSKRYLYCQFIGWGVFLVMAIIALGLIRQYRIKLLENVFVTFLAGLFITHLLRNVIRSRGWLNWPLRQGLPWLLLGTVLAALTAGGMKVTVISLGGMTFTKVGYSWYSRIFGAGFEYSILFLPWTIMYCLYHHIQKTRLKNVELRRLELLLKEKSAIAGDTTVDLESITRSLDRIRTLIDEDATRARAEITAFSQLLRKGYLKVNDPQ
jgi:two-component system LytT family sensor kinase